MATVAQGTGSIGPPREGLIDRWIFVFMAGLFCVTTLAGFIPSSLEKIAAVEAGLRPPFPPVLHLHAVLMGAWLTLLLTQTILMARGSRTYHMKLGLASLVLAPAIILTGFVLVPTIYGGVQGAARAAPPAVASEFQDLLVLLGNIALLQIRAGLLFAIFVFLALRARKTDPGFHKRMIILATVIPLPAAIDRITWLPHSFPKAPWSADLYVLLWIAPLFIWDLLRNGTVHRAYKVWFAFVIPAAIVVNALWGSEWWQQVVPRLLG
ncbi:MAG: hypothetical protein HKO13_09365 [Sphingomonas sp.]|nr:hypothetical protein [Sphingomonas sp.]